MRTIEERANEYAKPIDISDELLIRKEEVFLIEKRAFVAGANSEHEELTRWNSPDNHPDNNREVLVKIKRYADIFGHPISDGKKRFSIATFTDGAWLKQFDSSYYKIIGWREIHE